VKNRPLEGRSPGRLQHQHRPVRRTRATDTEALKGGASGGSQIPQSIVELEAVGVAVKADLSLTAIEVEVVDTNGAGFVFLLGPPSAVDLVVQVIGALSAIEDRLETRERLNEAQILLRTLVEP
jgi:hypothetical protein